MHFVPVSEARTLPGLRMVLVKGWAVWAEAAKQILYYKNIPYVAVAQTPWGDNSELQAWTGVRNQPQAIYNEEAVRTSWLEILNLAERLAPEPRLLPVAPEDRATVVGLSNEIAGEWGLGWCRRIQIAAGATAWNESAHNLMRRQYGGKDNTSDEAITRTAEIVTALGKRLRAQEKAGSRFFVGDSLSAADIYWVAFSNLLAVLPEEICPMKNPQLREQMSTPGPAIDAVTDPILLEHRDYVLREFLQCPLTFE
jgi:glutathione S-transferase